MADNFMVGRKGASDKYLVGNTGKEGYKVGSSGGKGMSDSSNSSLNGGDQDSPAGQKSAFSYSSVDVKDVGDRGENMNFGGGEMLSVAKAGQGNEPGGDKSMVFEEKGDWSEKKDAMKRRQAMLDNARQISSDNVESPVSQGWSLKK